MFVEKEPLIIHFSEMANETVHDEWDAGYVHGFENALEFVENMNIADVETIVMGKWMDECCRQVTILDEATGEKEKMFSVTAKCSICNTRTERMSYIQLGISYGRCPYCGAFMEEVV